MPDVILVTQSIPLGFGDTVPPGMGGITVHYVRANTRDDLDRLLSGATFNELSPRAIADHGAIIPPDGSPLEYSETGYPAIASFGEAIAVAKAARTNPKSILGEKGFAPDTPIYFFIAGRQAEQIEWVLALGGKLPDALRADPEVLLPCDSGRKYCHSCRKKSIPLNDSEEE